LCTKERTTSERATTDGKDKKGWHSITALWRQVFVLLSLFSVGCGDNTLSVPHETRKISLLRESSHGGAGFLPNNPDPFGPGLISHFNQ
jgi:hypothetical protein